MRAFIHKKEEEGGEGLSLSNALVGINVVEGEPLMRIERKDEEVRDNIHLIHQGEKSKDNIT
jgi:hypothetical protein